MVNREMVELITRIVLQQLTEKDLGLRYQVGATDRAASPILFVVQGSQAKVGETLAWLPAFGDVTTNPQIAIDLDGIEISDRPSWLTNNGYGTIIKQTDGIGAEEMVASAEAVVIPCLGQEMAVKLALGLNDTWIAKIVVSAIMKGKPVFAALDDILLPNKAETGTNLMPVPYVKLFNEYRKMLNSLNIRIIPRDQLVPAVRQFIKGNITGNQRIAGETGLKVLTESDVIKYHEMSSNEIKVLPRCIITPLARETAAKLGLTISIIR